MPRARGSLGVPFGPTNSHHGLQGDVLIIWVFLPPGHIAVSTVFGTSQLENGLEIGTNSKTGPKFGSRMITSPKLNVWYSKYWD